MDTEILATIITLATSTIIALALALATEYRRKRPQDKQKTQEKRTEKKKEEEEDFQLERDPNLGRVIAKIVILCIMLYIGGTIIEITGSTLNGTTSPYYNGLKLIGWNVTDQGTITKVDGTGIIAIIALIGVVSILMEFVKTGEEEKW